MLPLFSPPSAPSIVRSHNVENDKPPQGEKEIDAWRLKNFTERLGEENIPSGLQGRVLRGPDYKLLCRQILNNRVQEQIALRNGRTDLRPDTFSAEQIFHIQYQDGAAMITLAWVISKADEKTAFNNCQFQSLPFYRNDEHFYHIVAPQLTPKEIRRLNSLMPHIPPLDIAAMRQLSADTGIPEPDITNFAKIYKYYPMFAEVVL